MSVLLGVTDMEHISGQRFNQPECSFKLTHQLIKLLNFAGNFSLILTYKSTYTKGEYKLQTLISWQELPHGRYSILNVMCLFNILIVVHLYREIGQ